MEPIKRRKFLALVPRAVGGLALAPLVTSSRRSLIPYQTPGAPRPTNNVCWLDVCAPFVVEDPAAGISSELVLTSDTFFGASGYQDGADATEYEIYLYDSRGQAIGADGVAKRLLVPAMQTTVLNLSEILGDVKSFWGGMRVRLRPKGRAPMHASDLFSSAFLRWKTKESFDNVHANPDPLEWQRPDSFFYSMPFPPLGEYSCLFSLFNPYAEPSIGTITLYDELGQRLRAAPYHLDPHASLLFDLQQRNFVNEVRGGFGVAKRNGRPDPASSPSPAGSGTIAITNQQGSVKNFGYLLINRRDTPQFSVEHPIHQPPYKPAAVTVPFDTAGKFKPKNVLFTPLLFHSKQIAGLTFDTRFNLSSGAPMEESLWLSPLITDGQGKVAWQFTDKTRFPASIPPAQIERGVIRLGAQQNCLFDCSQIELPKGFAGGLFLAVAPNTNHTLMKVEVKVTEWQTWAFTHFRPGLASARGYQKPKERGGLVTDYVVSNARCEKSGGKIVRDEIIAILNIDDQGIAGSPTLQIFTSHGLLTEIKLDEVPAYGSRHYRLSELLSGKTLPADLSLRLVGEQAAMLMSVVHVDYRRRDIALDHGSDRFSTFDDFTCAARA